jgi:uncharacterized OsmC-like protein
MYVDAAITNKTLSAIGRRFHAAGSCVSITYLEPCERKRKQRKGIEWKKRDEDRQEEIKGK